MTCCQRKSGKAEKGTNFIFVKALAKNKRVPFSLHRGCISNYVYRAATKSPGRFRGNRSPPISIVGFRLTAVVVKGEETDTRPLERHCPTAG